MVCGACRSAQRLFEFWDAVIFYADSGQRHPKAPYVGRKGANLGRTCGQLRSTSGKACPTWAEASPQIWARCAEHRPALGGIDQTWAHLGQEWANVGQIRGKAPPASTGIDGFGPTRSEVRPFSAGTGRRWAITCRNCAEGDQWWAKANRIRPTLSQNRPSRC